MAELTGVDLFAGAGGATQGLKAAGIRVLAAIENDPITAATYALNHPATKIHAADIRTVDVRALRMSLGLARGELTILQACPPCPSWSSLGVKPENDVREALIDDVWRFLREFRPRAFVLENVVGLERDPRLARLVRRARGLGYGVRTYRADAADFRVPQRRVRLICLGVRGVRSTTFPTELASPAGTKRPTSSVFKLSSSLDPQKDPLHLGRRHTATVTRRLEALPAGGTRFDLPSDLTLKCHDDLQSRQATAAYGRMRLNDVAPTLTTRCTTPSCGSFVHPSEPRGITLREAALLQTFPAAYSFLGTYGEKERQIGNAIPVLMAKAVAGIAVRLVPRAPSPLPEGGL